jgi:hypothetical protein
MEEKTTADDAVPYTGPPIKQVLQLRQTLRRGVSKFEGAVVKAGKYEALVRVVRSFLPQAVKYDVLFESLRHLAGIKLKRSVLDATMWRIAGNLHTLRAGKPVSPWVAQGASEWVPAQITKVQLRRQRYDSGELGHEFVFQILAGSSCPLVVRQWWSLRRTHYVARYRDSDKNGFMFPTRRNRATRPKLFADARQLVSLRCLLLIEEEYCEPKEPGFRQISFSSSIAQWNSKMNLRRARLTAEYGCPFNYSPLSPCYTCFRGLNQCPLATHALTYEYRPCPRCKEAEAAFDPAENWTVCLACHETSVKTVDNSL